MITVRVDGLAEVQKKLAGLQHDLRDKVLQPAINKAAEKAKAEINRVIPQEYAVKAAEVRNAVEIRKARSGQLSATVTIFGSTNKRGRSLNMIHFVAAAYMAGAGTFKVRSGAVGVRKKDVKALGRQLGFQIKKGAGLKTKVGAFIGNKGRTVFIRVPGKQMKSRSGSLNKHSEQIVPVQVIGFSQMFSSKKISQRIMAKINEDLPKEVERAVMMRLEGRRF